MPFFTFPGTKLGNAKALVTKHHVGADEIFNEQFSFFIPTLEALIKGKPALTSNSRHF